MVDALTDTLHHRYAQARLERIRAMVVKKENLILNLTGDRQTLADVLVRVMGLVGGWVLRWCLVCAV